jgi:hypothetical protein
MTAHPAHNDPTIRFVDLRAGMIFIDAKVTTRRVVVLKPVYRDLVIWVATVGGSRGPFVTSLKQGFFWHPYTPHGKHRRSGFYLDTDIPGNTKERWTLVPAP